MSSLSSQTHFWNCSPVSFWVLCMSYSGRLIRWASPWSKCEINCTLWVTIQRLWVVYSLVVITWGTPWMRNTLAEQCLPHRRAGAVFNQSMLKHWQYRSAYSPPPPPGTVWISTCYCFLEERRFFCGFIFSSPASSRDNEEKKARGILATTWKGGPHFLGVGTKTPLSYGIVPHVRKQ